MATKSERQNRKAIIIEQIFDRRWDSATRSLKRDLVTLKDVSETIKRFNRKVPKGLKPLSDKNPANFFKDFILPMANFHYSSSSSSNVSVSTIPSSAGSQLSSV